MKDSTEQYQQALVDWCEQHITQAVADQLDKGELSGAGYYADFARQGFLAELADISKAPALIIPLMATVGKYSGALVNAVAVNLTCSVLLGMFGNSEQKKIATKILAGESSAAFLQTEEFAGSDVGNMQTRAIVQADNNWRLNGQKWFATGAQDAEWLLVVGRSNTDVAINKGTSVFCIPAAQAGVGIQPMNKICSLGFASCYVDLNDAVATADQLVGQPDQAWRSIAFTGGLERLMVAASAVGLSAHMLEFVTDFALKRTVNGDGIFNQQAIGHQLIDAKTKLRAAELMTANALRQMAKKPDASEDICMAKLFASEVQQEISSIATRVLGGRAYLADFPVSRWVREGQLSLYAGGTNEIQKNILTRQLLKSAAKQDK